MLEKKNLENQITMTIAELSSSTVETPNLSKRNCLYAALSQKMSAVDALSPVTNFGVVGRQ
jgi:hypothetical protein